MNRFSALFRVICGLVLVVLGLYNYQKNSAAVSAGEPVHLFGATFNTEPWQFPLVISLIVLIGLLFLLAGIWKLFRRR